MLRNVSIFDDAIAVAKKISERMKRENIYENSQRKYA